MKLLHKIFFITLIVFCNYSCAMEDNNVPTLQQLFDMDRKEFIQYRKTNIKNCTRDEQIFFAVLSGVKNQNHRLKSSMFFSDAAMHCLTVYGEIINQSDNDLPKFETIFNALYKKQRTFKLKQPDFNYKKSLNNLLYPSTNTLLSSVIPEERVSSSLNDSKIFLSDTKSDEEKLIKLIDDNSVSAKNMLLSSTISKEHVSSSLSETETDKESKDLIDEDSKDSTNLIDDNSVSSKFSSIIQTLRTNKLILGGTTFCIVTVLGCCAYVLYKNSIETKKENDKKEDDEVKEDVQHKEENVEVRKN